MTRIQEIAKALKAGRAVPTASPASNEITSPATSVCGFSVAGGSRLARLMAELRIANERADKAEASLAAVEKVKRVNGEIWRLQRQLARLRDVKILNAEFRRDESLAAKLRESAQTNNRLSGNYGAVSQKLKSALKRIDDLEAENERLLRSNGASSPVSSDT